MKSNEQLLREQIVELTKLLELKDQRIKELEALRNVPGNLILPNQQAVSQWVFNPGPSCAICTGNCSEVNKE